MTDHRDQHPTAPGRRPGYIGTGCPAIAIEIETDAGKVLMPMPARAVDAATIISSITMRVDGRILFRIPLYAHGIPLHTICTAGTDPDTPSTHLTER